MAWSRPKTRPLAPKTVDEYERILAKAFGTTAPRLDQSFAGIEPGGLTSLPLARGVDLQEWAPSECRLLRVAIHDHWARAGQAELGEFLGSLLPNEYRIIRKRPRPTLADAERFEQQAALAEPKAYRVLMAISLRLGLRVSELLGLSRPQVAEGVERGSLLFVRKGGQERELSIHHLKSEFRQLLALKAAIPTARTGTVGFEVRDWNWVRETLSRAAPIVAYHLFAAKVHATAEAAGLDPKLWSVHSLRHAFATRMHADGASLMVIKEALGHAFVTTTQGYVNVEAQDVAKFMRPAPAGSPSTPFRLRRKGSGTGPAGSGQPPG